MRDPGCKVSEDHPGAVAEAVQDKAAGSALYSAHKGRVSYIG